MLLYHILCLLAISELAAQPQPIASPQKAVNVIPNIIPTTVVSTRSPTAAFLPKTTVAAGIGHAVKAGSPFGSLTANIKPIGTTPPSVPAPTVKPTTTVAAAETAAAPTGR